MSLLFIFIQRDFIEFVEYLVSPAGRLAALIIALTVICGFLYKIWKWVKSIYLEIKKYRTESFNNKNKELENERKIEVIYRELKPNGGSSLRDAVNRIESNLSKVKGSQDAYFNLDDVARWRADSSGQVTEVNNSFCKLVGRRVEEITGSNWVNIVFVEDLEIMSSRWEQTVKSGSDWHFTWRAFSSNQEIVEVESKAKVLKNNEGKILGYEGAIYPTKNRREED